jgi:hypothetical protein
VTFSVPRQFMLCRARTTAPARPFHRCSRGTLSAFAHLHARHRTNHPFHAVRRRDVRYLRAQTRCESFSTAALSHDRERPGAHLSCRTVGDHVTSQGTCPVTRTATSACPLCGSAGAPEWYREPQREYWRCESCGLVFLSPEQRLDFEAEVERYRLHRNSEHDSAYLEFLSRLAEPMIARVPVGAVGLDYGCGPAPALALLMTRSGRPTVSYDPVFHPRVAVLTTQYNFVTCSEVLEHAHHPLTVLRVLQRLVAHGGRIGVMTRRLTVPTTDVAIFTAGGYSGIR